MNSEIAIIQTGAVVVVDLDRLPVAPAAIALATRLQHWAKSPEVYAVVLRQANPEHGTPASELTVEQAAELLKLLWRIDRFPKPLVSLLVGPLTPLAVGLSTFGTHRVAGEGYNFALPAPTDAASLPAAGVAHALARLPNALGADLALDGRTLGAAAAYEAGLLTHCIASSQFATIIAALADGQPVDPLLDGLHRDPQSASAVPTQPFALHDAVRGAMLRLIDEARGTDVRESLIATYRVAGQLRAVSATSPEKIGLHQPTIFEDLQLPTRAEIESGRF